MEKIKLCVIGDPVEHSLSPVIHNTILERSGLPYVYGRVQVRAEDTAAFLAQAKEELAAEDAAASDSEQA